MLTVPWRICTRLEGDLSIDSDICRSRLVVKSIEVSEASGDLAGRPSIHVGKRQIPRFRVCPRLGSSSAHQRLERRN